ncbi:unnamed protein product [Rangifer tarandus platyrhynchus]|uniref:Uncharacterized protein n=2 Tax=Rangifer tarandus platyrhynchus TaxID=3082113 RepID=A0ABN8YNP0_RANTA|nr:unnamed protein product [Rangifer tarandus platyrhynchus]
MLLSGSAHHPHRPCPSPSPNLPRIWGLRWRDHDLDWLCSWLQPALSGEGRWPGLGSTHILQKTGGPQAEGPVQFLWQKGRVLAFPGSRPAAPPASKPHSHSQFKFT